MEIVDKPKVRWFEYPHDSVQETTSLQLKRTVFQPYGLPAFPTQDGRSDCPVPGARTIGKTFYLGSQYERIC